MKAAAICLALLSLLHPALVSAETGYKPANLFQKGYRDRQIEPGYWKVSAAVDPESDLSGAVRVALYRAAELAKADRYDLIQIVWHRGSMASMQQGKQRMRMLGYSAELKVRGIRDGVPLGRCEMKESTSCPIKSVEMTLLGLEPTLKR
jgi:hypothetical protein